MLRSRFAAAASAAVFVLASQAVAAQVSVTTLFRSSDPLPTGETVDFFNGVALSENGSWAARATIGSEIAVLQDGDFVLREGDALDGETVVAFGVVRLTVDGDPLFVTTTEDSAGARTTRIVLGDETLLRTGTSITLPTTGEMRTLHSILGIASEDDRIVAHVIVTGSGSFDSTLLVGGISGNSIDWLESITRGQNVPGLSRPYAGLVSAAPLDVTSNGIWAASVTLDDPSGLVPGLVAGGFGAAEPGTQTPDGALWASEPSSFYRVAVNDNGRLASSGLVDLGGPEPVGVVYFEGDPIVVEGQNLIGTADTVAEFDALDLQLTDADETVHWVRTTNGVTRLRAGGATLLKSSTTVLPNGQTIGPVSPQFDASVDGSSVLCVCALPTPAGFGFGIVLVERNLDGPSLCATVPNSTGQAGQLSFVGSRWIQVNGFSVRASQLPPSQFGLLLNGTGDAFVANPAGSDGNLCLGGTLGRHNSALQSSGPAGEILFPTDLTAIPQPSQFIAVTSGQTLRFQVWHRDGSAAAPASNFTQARRIRFL